MFGTASTGSSSSIAAMPGIFADASGPAVVDRVAGAAQQEALAANPLVSAMLRDRKTVFIDRLGWDLESPDGLHELDQFDGEDTLYLVVHQPETMRHLGSVRLLPSTGPHLLGDIYPQLCADGVPRGADVWEITRLVTAPDLNRTQALQVRRQLSIALYEHALATGITRYTMITHMPWLASLLSIGWDAEPLGFPHGEGETAVAALQINIDSTTHQRLAQAWDMPATMLSKIDTEQTLAF
jgi:N-acyl-L-homoserine lactone synthetase